MSLPYDFTETIESFVSPIPIDTYDTVGGYQAGRWVEVVDEESVRIIGDAIVLEVDEQTLQLHNDAADISKAYNVMINSQEPLLSMPLDDGIDEQKRQSFVIIDDLEFKILKNYGTNRNSNFNSYLAVRYKKEK